VPPFSTLIDSATRIPSGPASFVARVGGEQPPFDNDIDPIVPLDETNSFPLIRPPVISRLRGEYLLIAGGCEADHPVEGNIVLFLLALKRYRLAALLQHARFAAASPCSSGGPVGMRNDTGQDSRV
jgi:hypothetical protein